MNRLPVIILLLLVIAILPFSAVSRSVTNSYDSILENYNNAEHIIREEGNYSKSLEFYLKFIIDAQNHEAFDFQMMRAYTSVSVIYGSFNDVENAMEFNDKAYSLAKKLGDTEILELTINNRAHFYHMKGDLESAARTADSLLMLDRSKSNSIMFHYWLLKGDIASRQGKADEALLFFKKAECEAESQKLSRYQRSAPLTCISEYYGSINQPDSQLHYLDRSWHLVSGAKDPAPKAEVARMLMKFHTLHGSTDEALKFQEIYFQLTDSLVNLRHFLRINAGEHQRRFAVKAEEVNNLSRNLSKHIMIIIVVAAALIFSLIGLAVILWQKRNLNKAYMALFEKNQRTIAIIDKTAVQEHAAGDEEGNGTVGISDSEEEESKNLQLYNRILKLMDSGCEYLNPDFGLSNIVMAVGSNFAYVSKVIKLYSGLNVPSFINEYRIREACRRILDKERFGNFTFTAIGESVGFSSQVSFNRTFKKVTGMTPSVYKKMAANSLPDDAD